MTRNVNVFPLNPGSDVTTVMLPTRKRRRNTQNEKKRESKRKRKKTEKENQTPNERIFPETHRYEYTRLPHAKHAQGVKTRTIGTSRSASDRDPRTYDGARARVHASVRTRARTHTPPEVPTPATTSPSPRAWHTHPQVIDPVTRPGKAHESRTGQLLRTLLSAAAVGNALSHPHRALFSRATSHRLVLHRRVRDHTGRARHFANPIACATILQTLPPPGPPSSLIRVQPKILVSYRSVSANGTTNEKPK